MPNGLIWLSTRRYTVGLVVCGGAIVETPPIARRWALGRDARALWREAARRGAKLAWLPD
jgi:hypothetical protein